MILSSTADANGESKLNVGSHAEIQVAGQITHWLILPHCLLQEHKTDLDTRIHFDIYLLLHTYNTNCFIHNCALSFAHGSHMFKY